MKTARRALAAVLLLSVAATSCADSNLGYQGRLFPAIVIELRYPGANARLVADAIAAPMERHLNGLPHHRSIRSRSSDDGLCRITVTFDPDADLSAARVLIDDRLKEFLPTLPEPAQREGVVIRQGSAGIAMILFVSSPDGKFDQLYLSNYANTHLKNELARVPGVAEVELAGAQEYRVRIWLDPDRLAAFGLAAPDVMNVLERQDLKPAAAPEQTQPDKVPALQLTLGALGQLAAVEELNDVVLRADAGREIQLRDVARVELGAAGANRRAQLDGNPGVAMTVHLLPRARTKEVTAAVEQLMARAAANAPEGVALEIAFDFSPNLEAPRRATGPQNVLLELDAPAGASGDRKLALLDRVQEVMRAGKEVTRVLSLTDNVFDRLPDSACVLVRVETVGQGQSERHAAIEAIRSQLKKQVAEVAVRLRDLSQPDVFPRCGYPIDFAVQGPDPDGARSLARKLAERLRGNSKLTDVWVVAETADRPRMQLDVDAKAAEALGVNMSDVTKTLQAAMGGLQLTGSDRNWQINLQLATDLRSHADAVKQLKVQNTRGEMVPLGALVRLRETMGPSIEERIFLSPMVELTANPAAGQSLAEVRAICVAQAAEIREELQLPGHYFLTRLDEGSAPE